MHWKGQPRGHLITSCQLEGGHYIMSCSLERCSRTHLFSYLSTGRVLLRALTFCLIEGYCKRAINHVFSTGTTHWRAFSSIFLSGRTLERTLYHILCTGSTLYRALYHVLLTGEACHSFCASKTKSGYEKTAKQKLDRINRRQVK